MNSRPTKFHSHIIIFFSAANIRVTFESFSCFQQFENKLAYLKLAAFLWIVEPDESSNFPDLFFFFLFQEQEWPTDLTELFGTSMHIASNCK